MIKLPPDRIHQHARFLLTVCALCAASIAQAATYNWSAASGLLPDSAGSPWRLERQFTSGAPTLTQEGLLISTTNINEMQYYVQDLSNVSATDTLIIEASIKIGRETPTISARAAASVNFTIAPYTGTDIAIGDNEVFWLSSSSTRGGTAFVDTKESFHTYRIEVTGNRAGNLFKVFQDNALILAAGVPYIDTGPLIASDHPQVYFGDGTRYSSGSSLWKSFSNNLSSVSSVPEPTSMTLFFSGSLIIFLAAAKRQSRKQ